MKKTFGFIALMLGIVCMVMFSSCNKHDDPSSNPNPSNEEYQDYGTLILGTWQAYSSTNAAGTTQIFSDFHKVWTFTFNKDMTCHEEHYNADVNNPEVTSRDITYEIDGNTLQLIYKNGRDVWTIQSLTNKELILVAVDNSVLVFERK